MCVKIFPSPWNAERQKKSKNGGVFCCRYLEILNGRSAVPETEACVASPFIFQLAALRLSMGRWGKIALALQLGDDGSPFSYWWPDGQLASALTFGTTVFRFESGRQHRCL
ncbi:hypothetical protein CEXT_453781 [Caerostris extrusa]|uniref:Uncharacterized protein n=1 Tax=Caerostris extrusa TaxID=172846 RepID=A0AAV4TJB9_CAEEX|nr:hypothetical protein CEXT_453781 [Caerostris extrusa]